MRNFDRSTSLKHQAGATLVEVLVAIGLLGVLMPALLAALITANNARPAATQQVQAASLLRETEEAVRSVREAGWSNVTANGTYHPAISGNGWALASGAETIGSFSRTVVISDVQRNSSGDIVPSAGTVDPATKYAVVAVSWTKPVTSSISANMYLTQWQQETSWQQTTQADFNGDTLTNTQTTNTTGGEVELQNGQASGSVESSTFDFGSTVGFMHMAFTADLPAGTTISLQIASNSDNATWNYVGPDGTGGTSYTMGGAIPLATASGRYVRFKATLATSNASTSVLKDVTVTYSP